MKRGLMRVRDIQGYELAAKDGAIGRCSDLLFNDEDWVVRYVVADTRKWLPGRKVLISPISIDGTDSDHQLLAVGLTKKQIKGAPPLDSHAPVSRQYEMLYNKYYQWPAYWDGALTWGPHPLPRLLQRPEKIQMEKERADINDCLRSTTEVIGYEIQATDTDIGHVEDFIVEEESWIIRYLVVDTSNWLPGSKRVIIAPPWVDLLDWGRKAVVVKLPSEQIKNGPEYDQSRPIDREYEEAVHRYYNLPHYW